MKVTGVLVNYFIHCPRQAWLFYNNIKMEHTSELVKIWKVLHELRYSSGNNLEEIEFDELNIKLDKLLIEKWTLIVEEFKKSNLELRAQFFQVLYYLYRLKELEVDKLIGKLIFDEKKKINEKEIKDLDYKIEGFKLWILPTNNNFDKLKNVLADLEKLLENKNLPDKLYNKTWGPNKKCRWCSFYQFCWV
jgi:CRISPR-associated exonuclease Cas4